jgi:hypothetical protein
MSWRTGEPIIGYMIYARAEPPRRMPFLSSDHLVCPVTPLKVYDPDGVDDHYAIQYPDGHVAYFTTLSGLLDFDSANEFSTWLAENKCAHLQVVARQDEPKP